MLVLIVKNSGIKIELLTAIFILTHLHFTLMNHTLKSILILCIVFVSCNRADKADRKISNRNYSINQKNSYSDFFFDSVKLATYIIEKKVPDSVGQRMISFYNNRNYQYAWFASDGPTEQAMGFWNMYTYYLTNEKDKAIADKELAKSMESVMAVDEENDWSSKNKKLLPLEMKLTEHFIRYFLDNTQKDYLKRKELEKFIPVVKTDAIHFADSLVNKKQNDDKYFDEVNKHYKTLKQYLEDYLVIQKNGGWPVVSASAKTLNKHKPSPALMVLKKRLQLGGDYPAGDSSQTWNDNLTVAVKKFQETHGFTADAKLTDEQLKQMNVPVLYRIKQLLINLSRMRLMVQEPEGKFIYVNIPEYQLHVTEKGNKIFDMPVVVGKQGNNTRSFAGNMNQVVFAPYWNVPANIIKNEINREIESNSNYLEEHNMEVNGTLPDGSPAIRQKPGEDNALGRVKFLFPNSFDIYFHDTPAKSFFSKDKRAYSHGCIRLSDPVKLAKYVLKDEKGWNDEAINKALKSTEEKFVTLKDPIPVLITYYTAWADDKGQLHFAEDIYGHDKALTAKMFLN